MSTRTSLSGRLIIKVIRGYQYISPDQGILRLLGSRSGVCMYYPTCSEYMVLSIEKYGARGGIARGLRRIGRCRPGKEPAVDMP